MRLRPQPRSRSLRIIIGSGNGATEDEVASAPLRETRLYAFTLSYCRRTTERPEAGSPSPKDSPPAPQDPQEQARRRFSAARGREIGVGGPFPRLARRR
jgi:hypothetical protein